jgi:hypothetical protein
LATSQAVPLIIANIIIDLPKSRRAARLCFALTL